MLFAVLPPLDGPLACGPVLLACAVVVLLVARRLPPADPPPPDPVRAPELAGLAAFLAAAAVLRFARLGTIPPGINVDEAIDGLQGVRVWSGEAVPALPGIPSPRLPVWHWIAAAATWLGGVSVPVVRFPAALAGLATVVVVWRVARRALGPGGALVAAGFLATSFWHVHLSRFGTAIALVPLEFALAAAVVLDPDRRRRPGWLAVLGLGAGAACWDYLAAWTIPAWILVTLAGAGVFAHEPPGRVAARIAAFLLGFALTAWPAVAWFGVGFSRTADVGLIPAAGLPAKAALCIANLVAAVDVHGAAGAWLNYPFGAARCSPVETAAVLAGAAALFADRAVPRPWAWGLGAWAALAFAPDVLAAGGINLPRAAGTLPALALMAGCAVRFLPPHRRRAATVAALTFGVANGALTADRLFVRFPADARIRGLYLDPVVRAAEDVRTMARSGPVALAPYPTYTGDPALRFLLWNELRGGAILEGADAGESFAITRVYRDPVHRYPVLFLLVEPSPARRAPRRVALLNANDLLSDGRLALAAGRDAEAERLFRRLLAHPVIQGDFGMAHGELGLLFARRRRWREALAEIDLAGAQGVLRADIPRLERAGREALAHLERNDP